jgi:hypothetical protein
VRSLSDSWRQPLPTRPPPPNSAPAAVFAPSGRAFSPPIRDASPPNRDAEYERRKRDLENAWRNPPGVFAPQRTAIGAGPAAFVERVGEVERERKQVTAEGE